MAASSSVFEEDGTTLLSFADGRTIRAPSALLYDVLGNPLVTNPAAGQAGAGLLGAVPMLGNGATFDPQQNNLAVTLLPSAARTTQQTTAVQTNYNARGALFVLDITAASGTGGLRLGVNVPSVVTPADVFSLNTIGAVTLQAAVGTYGWLFYPGAGSTGVNSALLQVVGIPLPRSWSVTVYVGDASSYTYSLSAYLIN